MFFKLLKDGRKVGGDRAHPAVSTIDNSTIFHPYVDCFVDHVRVRALIDSCSMKSFISKSVQRTIDFDDLNLNKTKKEKCALITGHNVNIEGHLYSTIKFLGSRECFNGKFLLSNDIQYMNVSLAGILSATVIYFCVKMLMGVTTY